MPKSKRIIPRKATRPPRDRGEELRAIQDFIRKRGVTKCPPGSAEGSGDLAVAHAHTAAALEVDPSTI